MTLRELDRVDGPALLSLAVVFGTTRLIDNVPLGLGGLTMRIAAAQIHPAWGRPDLGAARVAEWIGRAGDEGVDLRRLRRDAPGRLPVLALDDRRRALR